MRVAGIILIAILWPAWIPTSLSARTGSDFIVRVWQMEDGLPHNNVEAVAQTQDGYLWVGTTAGLARFDGARFVVFDGSNTPELEQSYIRALRRMRDGSLWIGTASGTLVRWHDGKFISLPTATFNLGNILSLYEAEDGVIWAGADNGLLRHAQGKWQLFTTRDGLLHNSVRAVCEFQGELIIGTDLGANVWRDGKFVALNPTVTGPTFYLRALWPDHAGNLWLGFRYGLGVLNARREFTLYTRRDGLPDENETMLFQDQRTNLWIGSMGGLSRWHDGKFFVEYQADGSSYGRVRCMFEDREGNLWVGTRDGLSQLRPRRFHTYTTRNGLAHNNVMSVTEDRQGNIWCTMWGGGLARLRGDTIQNFSKEDPPPNALTADNLLCVFEDTNGDILVGQDYEGGVFRFHDGTFSQPYPAEAGSTNDATRVIYRDRLGELWFGLNTGLLNWNAKQKFLSDAIVRDITEDAAGKLWVASSEGVFRRGTNGFERITETDGTWRGRPNCLLPDSQGNLWIGTVGRGLHRRKPDGQILRYDPSHGLPSLHIGEVLEVSGWLWFGSTRGIFRVRLSDFDELDAERIATLRCISYGREDGLVTVQCNDFAKPAAWKGRDGRLWFATIKGLAVIDPDAEVERPSTPPPVLIEEIGANRNHYTVPETATVLKIPPGRGDVEIHYTGLSLDVPERVRFRYKLEGRDPDWVDADNRRSIYFSNLQPGKYRFLVTACNRDGLWNQAGAELDFVLAPHFWQTWWFKVFLLVATAAAAYAIYRFRANRFRQIERLRMRIAADLHDDIGSSVASIALLSQLGQRDSAPAMAKQTELSEINRIAQQTAQNIREIVWFINPDYDTLPEMVSRMRDVAATMLSGVEHRFETPDELDAVKLSLEFRRDVFLVFKESLHNIVKHAQAHQVDIEVRAVRGEFHLRIRDDGVGFDPQKSNSGNGLKNLRLRLEQLGGKVEVESAPKRGTTLEIRVRITGQRQSRPFSGH
jgi:ligand-binding sensor domain-containing protein/signal transduction histidine kinase